MQKLNVRSGFYKLFGEFGLSENLYYGSIFICMTLIVLVCFLVINNRHGVGGMLGTADQYSDTGNMSTLESSPNALEPFPASSSGSTCELLLDPVHGEVHQTGRLVGDRAIYTCAAGWEIVGPEERVCQGNGRWSNTEPYCKKRGELRKAPFFCNCLLTNDDLLFIR